MISEENVRTAMLIGEDSINKLRDSHIAVFGAGGVGSYIIEAAVRAGIGEITVIDADTVASSNINRQIIATHSTVGKKKVEAVRERILDIAPQCRVNAYDIFFDASNANMIDFSKFDYVADAIDTIGSKVLIAKLAKAASVPLISSMGTGNKLDASKFEITDIYKTSVCPLAREMRRLLHREGINSLKVLYSTEEAQKPLFQPNDHDPASRRMTPASISYVPATAGLLIAGEIIRELIS